MSYSFTAYSHPNITGAHKTTLEFTKDEDISKNADCIIGVNADFDLNKLIEIVKNNKKIKVTIKAGSLIEEVICEANTEFSDEKEIVIRKTEFISKRTFGINADKASCDLNRKLIRHIQQKDIEISISIQKA